MGGAVTIGRVFEIDGNDVPVGGFKRIGDIDVGVFYCGGVEVSGRRVLFDTHADDTCAHCLVPGCLLRIWPIDLGPGKAADAEGWIVCARRRRILVRSCEYPNPGKDGHAIDLIDHTQRLQPLGVDTLQAPGEIGAHGVPGHACRADLPNPDQPGALILLDLCRALRRELCPQSLVGDGRVFVEL